MSKILWMALALGVLFACPFDTTLREYLNGHFWLPFSKVGGDFAKKSVKRLKAAYAGMDKADGEDPLARLRKVYQQPQAAEGPTVQRILAQARSAPNLSRREQEEVELIDAKLDMWAASDENPAPRLLARKKLEQFLRSARTPEFLSEARGWLAHIHYRLGDQTAAGKVYLDELNRSDSNLSYEVLINSLRMTYGYDGGPKLREHLHEYFDTPSHAAFAIQLVTNPHWQRGAYGGENDEDPAIPYKRIKSLLEKNASLLRSENGSNALALLAMRTALRAGDPPAALRLAANVPVRAAIRVEPDFLWMLASARFLSKDYAGAEAPLLQLYASSRATGNQKSAAAYGLCGVYMKTGNQMEQLRYALLLNDPSLHAGQFYDAIPAIANQTVYWASSGWDAGLLLDGEASIESIQEFIEKYPRTNHMQTVRYSLAVRLARENRYEEAAQVFASIGARLRAGRMRQMAALYKTASAGEVAAKFRLAAYLSGNSDRIYFNDRLWNGYQRHALAAGSDSRFTRPERERQIAIERKLKDDQEELWRAHLILREVVRDEGPSELGKRAAALAIQCVRRLSDRFERAEEIRAADIELSRWLRRNRK
ncbi:MAG: tetratricopeptide repeat protein [Acidobacteria bacterium]|nr:tetratricopeptide repeat protein [Acidobacteriota bacterium]